MNSWRADLKNIFFNEKNLNGMYDEKNDDKERYESADFHQTLEGLSVFQPTHGL